MMMTTLKQFKESRLVPRNLETRIEKLRQQNLRMLQQEVIVADLIYVDETWNFTAAESKCRKIQCNVMINFMLKNIPEWLKNVEILGKSSSFRLFDHDEGESNLQSFLNCPKSVDGDVSGSNSLVHNLKGMTEIIGRNFYCRDNRNLVSLEGMPKIIEGNFYCFRNGRKFTEKDIPEGTVIKGISQFK